MSNEPRKPTIQDVHIAALGAMVGGLSFIQSMAASESRAGTRIDAGKEPQQVKLPARFDRDDQRVFDAWGVLIGDYVKDDQLFRHCRIPAGWKTVPTSHHMYSYLVDEQGQPRIHIMYKGNFWDRDAGMNACVRYHADFSCDDWTDKSSPYFPVVRDGLGKIYWRGKPVQGKGGEQMDECKRIAQDVLAKACPLCGPHWQVIADYYKLEEARNVEDRKAWEEALKEAREKRREAKYQLHLLYWDVAGDFPPSESAPPTGQKYECRIELYRGGHYVDGDSIGSSTRASDEDAIKHFEEKARDFAKNYDEVKFQITLAGKIIKAGSVYKELPKAKRG